jgi:hypothetical protein
LAALALVLLGCGKDDGGSGPTKNAPLLEFNAFEGGGRTIRWPNLPIRVFLGNGVARPDEVTVWTGATGGAVTFTFVGSVGNADIRFAFIEDNSICGRTFLDIPDDGRLRPIVDVEVSRSIYRGPQCVRTVTHETAHAIGFLDHTDDGGLMDPDGGNGAITPLVAGVLRDLYSLPPNTRVVAQAKRLGFERPGGGRTVTFVYRPRQ